MKGGPETIVQQRLWEIDLLRGLAIVLMVIFHLGYDLAEFFHQPVTWQTGWLYATGKIAAIMFVFLAGLSSTFSRSNGKRGLKLLVLALVITLVTSLALPGSNIIFGVLHCLGTSMIVYLL
ncbi:MAG: heparan-alpha-glucosaminide N-acetyltransferase domain-containing protein, partial [Heliobacteriaceae bacterium]|nr:heparan-alpha-glucosaminide N-acetyltransferase domain-containing protein [Heliobacteriaceae bacterium]